MFKPKSVENINYEEVKRNFREVYKDIDNYIKNNKIKINGEKKPHSWDLRYIFSNLEAHNMLDHYVTHAKAEHLFEKPDEVFYALYVATKDAKKAIRLAYKMTDNLLVYEDAYKLLSKYLPKDDAKAIVEEIKREDYEMMKKQERAIEKYLSTIE